MKERVVVKLTAHMCDNVSYLSVKDGQVDYGNQALSNMFEPASLFKWAVQDAKNSDQVLKAVRRYARHAKKIELVNDY